MSSSGYMREIHISDPGAAEEAIKTLQNDVVMVQMPTVFVLLAPPNTRGASWLNRTKTRRPNKNYGTALGDLGSFYRMAIPGSLPPELDSVTQLTRLTGAFIRIRVASHDTDSVLVRAGTHQGLLLEGAHRELFRKIEAGLEDAAEPPLIGGHTFTAPLCTSANISGHPDGSIIAWERAYEFGIQTRIPLVIRAEADTSATGSYPIFWLQKDRISIERDGPGVDALKAAMPAHLFK